MGKLDDLENTKELRIPEGKPSTSSLVNSECALTPLSPTRDDSNLSNGEENSKSETYLPNKQSSNLHIISINFM